MDRDELLAMIDAERWDDLLVRVKVAPGDLIYVPSGTLHAVGPGMLVYEIQQNCDTTYRVFDFDRVDAATGTKRELHLDKAREVLTEPFDPTTVDTSGPIMPVPGGAIQLLVRGDYFELVKYAVGWDGHGGVAQPLPALQRVLRRWLPDDGPSLQAVVEDYVLVTIVDGSGVLTIDGVPHAVTAGTHGILPAGTGPVTMSGRMTVLMAHATAPDDSAPRPA
jgi:mannose-6-phosphate isomerase